jgi:hypothetical protein
MHGSLLCLSCCRSSQSACICFPKALFIICLDNPEFKRKINIYCREYKNEFDNEHNDVITYDNYKDRFDTLDEAIDFVTNYYENKFTKFNIY